MGIIFLTKESLPNFTKKKLWRWKWINCLHLTINKMLCALWLCDIDKPKQWGSVTNCIVFNKSGTELHLVGRRALVLCRRNARTLLSCASRKGTWGLDPVLAPWPPTSWPVWWRCHVSLVKPEGCSSSWVEGEAECLTRIHQAKPYTSRSSSSTSLVHYLSFFTAWIWTTNQK